MKYIMLEMVRSRFYPSMLVKTGRSWQENLKTNIDAVYYDNQHTVCSSRWSGRVDCPFGKPLYCRLAQLWLMN